MKEPLVSIIIPTFNTRLWLGEAIDSALAQIYPNCEVLVVDDGSTDGTGEWLAEQYGSRISCFWKENGGLASARNLALTHAQGDYIQFLDADDIIVPEKVATHVSFLEDHPEYGVVYCHSFCFRDDSPQEQFDWWGLALYRSGEVFSSMIDNGYILTHAALSRRSCIEAAGPFDEGLPSCVDWDFWLRVARAGVHFYYLDGRPMALYRLRPNRMSARRVIHSLSGIQVLYKLMASMPSEEERRSLGIRKAIGRWRFSYGRALVEDGALARGWKEMVKSLWFDRRNLRYKLGYMAGVPFLGHKRTLELLSMGQRVLGHASR